ncbi:MAG: hypothetical protein HY674_11175 [Chloroflexi bacterium]|nr:hypothetical protein [Chloroflexota bacterium]
MGQPTRIVVQPGLSPTLGEEFVLVGYRGGREALRDRVEFTDRSLVVKETDPLIDRVVLLAGGGQTWREVASLASARNGFEADAEASPEVRINPIDLGAVFPPADWLLLKPGQRAHLHVAAFGRTNDVRGARVVAWFEARPSRRAETALELIQGKRSDVQFELPEPSFRVDRDILQVSIQGHGGVELWRKQLHVMLVRHPPAWPRFGASQTRLRYDLPISLRDPKTGTLSSMPYEQGWSPQFRDVVVSLPNGSRFVFWRGSSYVPFWAGQHNTGLSYEWAETGPLPEGFVDSVEPLMDKELRYGRVQIIESAAARVHVRWSYQSCDFNYKVWGDAADEDFYFYPDGFGTRVLTLRSALGADYEVSEFIVLAPAEGYPLDLLPANPIRSLALDGTTALVPIPFVKKEVSPGPKPPLIYRVQFHKEERETAVYFNPRDPFRVEDLVIFRPFWDQGHLVTPAYWGSHWPLARGNTTGGAIDNRIHVSPSHNSLMSWARHRPEPVWSGMGPSIDTLGRSKVMQTQRWVWLIGVTDESDEHLIARARSFSDPPPLEVPGARFDIDSYVPARRAYRFIVEDKTVTITIKPTLRCVNPVFELLGAPRTLIRVKLANRRLRPEEYAWDGRTLWLNADITEHAQLQLEFNNSIGKDHQP